MAERTEQEEFRTCRLNCRADAAPAEAGEKTKAAFCGRVVEGLRLSPHIDRIPKPNIEASVRFDEMCPARLEYLQPRDRLIRVLGWIGALINHPCKPPAANTPVLNVGKHRPAAHAAEIEIFGRNAMPHEIDEVFAFDETGDICFAHTTGYTRSGRGPE